MSAGKVTVTVCLLLKNVLDKGYTLKQAKEGKVPTEDSSSVKIQKPAKVDYNTLPAQQSVSAMQREIAYLRQQIEFLKKITELDNDRKPRT